MHLNQPACEARAQVPFPSNVYSWRQTLKVYLAKLQKYMLDVSIQLHKYLYIRRQWPICEALALLFGFLHIQE